MIINLQLFGGGGGTSGGSFKSSSKPPLTNKPNSKYTWYRNGKKFQERWYDQNGNPKQDKDYTNHNNPKQHPYNPHYHDWNGKSHGRGYWIDENGNKHYY